MTWKHRILVTRTVHDPDDVDAENAVVIRFDLAEVQYDEQARPIAHRQPFFVPAPDSPDQIRHQLDDMRQALDRPFLWADDDMNEFSFPDEFGA